MKKKIYIAGKVTGLPEQEVRAKFQKAQLQIEASGYEAVNPINVVGHWDITWKEAMRKCLKALVDCDGIVMLDDWHLSKGAKIEFKLAMDLELDVLSINGPRSGFIMSPRPHQGY